MRRVRCSARRAGDDGSALVLALVFLSLFGLFVSVLLSFAQTGLRTTLAVRDQRSASFAADGGVDGAINYIRSNASWGVDPAATGGSNSCPAFTSSVNGRSVDVACEGASGSGVTTPGGGGNPSNTPEYAILALGPNSGGEAGISQGGPQVSAIGGPIFSNTSIDVATSGQMGVAGDATAHSCSAPSNILASGTRNCSSSAVEADPGLSSATYDPLVSTPPAAGTLPVCNGATAGPGTFSGSMATSLENAINGCNGTIRFAPGVYYFDFPSTNLVWTIDHAPATVVGGTPGAVPGTCDPAQAGIQFIFGGETQLDIRAGIVALCADPSTTRQQIAIYGVRSGAGSVNATLTAAPPATSAVFTSPDSGRVGDNAFASATVDNIAGGVNPSSATLTASGYLNTVPAGATITSVVLRILHKESGSDWNSGKFSRSVAITPGGAASATTLTPAPAGCGTINTVCTYSSANLSTTLSTAAKITGLKVDYAASMDNGGSRTATESVDAMFLDVTYTTPGLKAQTGCVVAPGGCSFLNTTGNNTNVRVYGTVYAPLAKVTLAHPNDSGQRFERGVIARAVSMQLPASTVPSVPYVNLPSVGPPTTAPRTVLFTASVDGRVRLRALVAFDDASAGHTPDVRSWSVIR